MFERSVTSAYPIMLYVNEYLTGDVLLNFDPSPWHIGCLDATGPANVLTGR
jgi:hypothetical protein